MKAVGKIIGPVSTALFRCLGPAAADDGPTSESRSVEINGAETVSAYIKMVGGELRIRGGGTHLLDARFTYDLDEWRPEVSYEVSGTRGKLAVRQPPIGSGGSGRYEWDLALSGEVPMELRIEVDTGESELRLGSLSLTKLEVEQGVGNAVVDLVGRWRSDLDASITGNAGTITVRVPGDVGVLVQPAKEGFIGGVKAQGLKHRNGDYVNSAYGRSEATLRIAVELGVGTINLEVDQAADLQDPNARRCGA